MCMFNNCVVFKEREQRIPKKEIAKSKNPDETDASDLHREVLVTDIQDTGDVGDQVEEGDTGTSPNKVHN